MSISAIKAQDYNPDILNTLANLSSDEVFTPPEVANQVLDLLPQELFRSPDTTFLDPATKSGVFLREIARRLMSGLEEVFPDEQERRDHIFHHQLFGIAITELTSLMSRRSLYCSKFPNGRYSVSRFDSVEGNIRFKQLEHRFINGRCAYCGASEGQFGKNVREGLEYHAYEFIHTTKPEEIFRMRFDVIIGNPPYQMNFGIEGGNKSNAKSIYNLFIEQATKLNPRYLSMITPSRWMTKTAQGIADEWVEKMIQSNNFRVIHDFEDSVECFPGVVIMGGVNYFLWERDYDGKCEYHFHSKDKNVIIRNEYLDINNNGIVIRDPQSFSIMMKIIDVEGHDYSKGESSFSSYVSPKHFFDDSISLTSNWSGYSLAKDEKHRIKYYMNKNTHNASFAWVRKDQIPKNSDVCKLHKVYIGHL